MEYRSNDKINEMINTGGLAQSGGFKNYIINGGFDIWQRGTNGGSSNGYKDADRFMVVNVLSRGKSTATTYPLGFSSAYKITKNNTQDTQIIQKIEFPKDEIKTTTNGRTFTMSAWILSDVDNAIENIFIIKNGSSSNAYEVRSNNCDFVDSVDMSNLAHVWKRISMTFTFDWTYESGDYIEIRIDPPYRTALTLHTTGWQLEEGSVATPFEQRPYGLELSLCQRYFYANNHIGAGVWNGTTQFLCSLNNPVPFRVIPTITTKSGVWSNINIEYYDIYDITSIAINHGLEWSDGFVGNPMVMLYTSGSRTYGYGGVVLIDKNNDTFWIDAEL